MFQDNEIINLCISLVSFCIVMRAMRRDEIPDFTMIYAGFFCIFGATVFTVVEGVIWNSFFNTVEHLCYALAGLAFAAGLLGESTKKDEVQGQETP